MINISDKTIPVILSELFNNEIFYKLIIFESLDNDKFMNFIKRFKFKLDASEYKIVTLHGIYIKFKLESDQIEDYFEGEEISKLNIINITNKLRYTKLTNHDKFDSNDYVFHILELDYYKKNENFKQYIENEVLDVKMFNNIISIINKNSEIPYENLLDNTIQNLKIEQNKDVLTFLKLRNDQDEDGEYNERFKIFLNKKPSKLALYYKNDNMPFYKLNDKQYKLIPDLKDIHDKPITFKDEDYNYKYLFGPFTKIFIPIQPNDEIAQNMETIKTSLKDGKDVFVIGYGASGAGKTSTLVYLKTAEKSENGIVINICNQLSHIFKEIQLSSIELYEQTGTEQAKVIRSRPNKETYDFILDEEKNEFLLQNQIIHQNKHGMKDTKEFVQHAPIGDVIIHMIDNDRLIFGTTNNPRSSRSHALIFLKLKYKTPPHQSKDHVYLIIGDFAGVENKFECDKPEVIKRFSEIHVTRRNGAKTEKIYAYKASGGKSRKNKNKIKGGMIAQPQQSEQPQQAQVFDIPTIHEPIDSIQPYIYDFDKPEYRTQWNIDKQLFIKVFIIIKKYIRNFNLLTEDTFLKLSEQLTAFKNAGSIEAERIAHEAKVNKNIKDILDIITQFVTNIKFKEQFKSAQKTIFMELVKNTFESIEKIIKPYDKSLTIDTYIETIQTKYSINFSVGQTPLIPLITKSFEDIQDISLFDKIQTLYNDSSLLLLFLSKNCSSSVWRNIFGIDVNTFKQLMFIFYVLPAFIEANPLVGQVSKVNIFEGIGDTDRAQEIIDKFKDLYTNSEKNKLSLMSECTLRLNEGIFINKSLQDLRTIIKDIISEKNKGIVIPNFIGDCFDKYFKNDYFKSSKSTTSNISSVIINEIINEIFVPIEGQEKPQQEKEKETFKKDFLHNLIISIFCVFNISRGANNPPPTHYIDINKLKYIFKNDKKNNQITQILIDELAIVKQLITTLGIDFSESPEYDDLKFITSPSKNKKFLGYIQYFNNFIDNFNAPSAVGTLDFLDSLAKYNTIDNICRIDSDFRTASDEGSKNSVQSSGKDEKIDTILKMNNMVQLYEENVVTENNFNSLIKKEQAESKQRERLQKKTKQNFDNGIQLIPEAPVVAPDAKPVALVSETVAEVAPVSKPEPEVVSDAATEVKPRVEPITNPVAVAVSEAAPLPESNPKPDPEAHSEAAALSDTTPKPEAPLSETLAEVAPVSKPEPVVAPEPKPNAEPTAGTQPNAAANKVVLKSEPQPEKAQTTEQLIEIAKNYNDAALNACLTLGDFYKTSDINKAIEYYEKAAVSYDDAYTKLSLLYLEQIKDVKNPTIINEIHYKLGLIYEFGKGVEQNYNTAQEHYETASKSGLIAAIRRLGIVFMKKGDYNNATQKLSDAYNKQDHGAVLCIVQLYELIKRKIGEKPENHEKIYALNQNIKALLEYGQTNNMLDIILFISKSKGEPFDTIKQTFIDKIKLYKPDDIGKIKENSKNDESAQFILGMMYDNGLIESEDKDKANYWYKKSYESEYSPAIFIIEEDPKQPI